jgi:hypothetical protein
MQFAKVVYIKVVVLFVLFCGPSSLAQDAWIEQVANKSLPSVVTVLAFDQNGKGLGLGSGFIITSNGLIVTNYHVIQGASKVEVLNSEIGKFSVRGIVNASRKLDFAILKIAAVNLPTIAMGNSNQIRLGEGVIAIGNPKGLTGTISAGLISQIRDEESYKMIQTSSPIYPGNSGGPLINRRGEVVGIVSARLGENATLGFALPINYVRASLQENTAVRFNLAALAQVEKEVAEEEAEAEIKRAIEENFTFYKDPQRLFQLLAPKNWRIQRESSWATDRSAFYHTTVIHPENAALAQIGGYVSEGIRIQMTLPPQGRVWTSQYVADWRRSVAQNLIKNNPGFAISDEQPIKFGDLSGRVYSIVGQDRRLKEPEKTLLCVFSSPKALVTVEIIMPTSKLEALEMLTIIVQESFKTE